MDPLEQAESGTEECRHQVNLDFVDQVGAQKLLGDRGAPGDADTLVAGGGPCLRQGAFDALDGWNVVPLRSTSGHG